MKRKEKNYTIEVVRVGNRGHEIVSGLVKREIVKVLEHNGVVSSNLDEVLEKYIPAER